MRILLLATIAVLSSCGQKEAQDQQDASGLVVNIQNDQTIKAVIPSASSVQNESEPQTTEPALPVANESKVEQLGSIPVRLRGRWAGMKEQCGDAGAPLQLTITSDSLLFHESVGTAKKIMIGPDGKLSILAAFTGEGQEWTKTITLKSSEDGRQLTVTNDGQSVVRKHCSG